VERKPVDRYARARILVDHAEPAQARHGIAGVLDRVCTAAVGVVLLSGAAVHLMTDSGHEGVAASSDPRAREWGEVAFTAGEGPCLDAWHGRRPVLVPDLSTQRARWPGYSASILDLGVGCVLAFPLSIGAVAFGVLEGYDVARGAVDSETAGMLTAFARVATDALIDGPQPDGSSARELSATVEPRIEIHQAQGMVMVALEVSLAEALLRMRAHAFAIDVPLLVLAQEVVAKRSDPREWA
jgi:hypothetical protein